MSARFVLTAEARWQQDVRKSRFLALAAPVEDADSALAFVARTSLRDASHNTFAYRIGSYYRCADDGEPSGTAGRPILAAIDAQGIDRAVVLVARWFGGIKLGAGGLARAYGGTAAECLRLAPRAPWVERVAVRVRCDFASAAALRARLDDFAAVKRDERALADGVELDLELPSANVDALAARVRDLTRGRGRVDAATKA